MGKEQKKTEEREQRQVEILWQDELPEDLTCAEALTERLKGGTIDMAEIRMRAELFILENYASLYKAANIPEEIMRKDIEIILDLNSRPVVPLCTRRDDGLIEVRDGG